VIKYVTIFAKIDATNNNKVILYPKTTSNNANNKGVYTPNTEKPIICLKIAIIKVHKIPTSTNHKIFIFKPDWISFVTK